MYPYFLESGTLCSLTINKQKRGKEIKGKVKKHIDTNNRGKWKARKEIEILSESVLAQAWNTVSLVTEHKDSDSERKRLLFY